MKLRTTALNASIAMIWLFLLVDAYLQGLELPELVAQLPLPLLPVYLLVSGAVLVCLVISAVTFWQRKRLMEDFPFVSSLMSRWFFEGAYGYFMARFYPVHVSILSSFILGAVSYWVCLKTSAGLWSIAFSLGSMGFALSLFLTVCLSRKYPPVLKWCCVLDRYLVPE